MNQAIATETVDDSSPDEERYAHVKSDFESRLELYLLVALVIALSIPALWGLGDHYLWQDEAQTALLARTVLDHGIPMGMDGENHLSQELGAEYGEGHIWCWHTWFPFYLLGGFFKVFGESTFVARLPFTLFGIATLPVCYVLSKKLWHSRAGAIGSVVVLGLCVAFLLLARQCRWYMPASFFSAMAVWGYVRLLQKEKWGSEIFVISLLLLFHTHYFYVVTFLVAFFAHCLLWNRDRLRTLAAASGILLLLCAPWIFWLSGIRYDEQYGERVFSLSRAAEMMLRFLTDIEQHVIPWYLLEVPIVVVGFMLVLGKPFSPSSRHYGSSLTLLAFVCGATLCALSLTAPEGYFRYLAPILPCIAVLMGGMIALASSLHWSLGIIVTIFVIARYPLDDFASELTHDFQGPVGAIVEHLNEHAHPDDVVCALYGDMPIKFYTDLRVLGGLTGEDMSSARGADWIILRRDWRGLAKVERATTAFTAALANGRYEKIVLDAPDTPFENREDPNEHLFRSSRIPERVVIWKRIE